MLIVDGHLDLAWNALQWGRDLRRSVPTLRRQEAGQSGPGRGQNTVALPELRQGRVALCFATLLARSTGNAEPHLDYASPAQAYGAAQGQLAYYRALEQQGHVRLITSCIELDTHLAAWQRWEALSDAEGPGAPSRRDPFDAEPTPPLGIILSFESADPVLEPVQLESWWPAGVRLIGPAHYGPGRYAGGTGTELGLTRAGIHLLREMQRLGIILDVTHLSDAAFWEALDHYHGPVLASHNNCRALVAHQRQLSDEQLRALFARGGVVGAALDNWMLAPDWVKGSTEGNPTVSLAHVVDHIDHVCQLAGSSQHAALGSDLDGGFGREQSPHDLDTIADLQAIPALLSARGYTEADVEGIMHGNWLRMIKSNW
jgi:membrane dipeptidase